MNKHQKDTVLSINIGIIGGWGIYASSYFQNLLYDIDNINVEQDHFNYVVLNIPKAPDRTAALNSSINRHKFYKYLDEVFAFFITNNIRNFCVTCNTAHKLISDFGVPSNLNFINMIDLTLENIEDKYQDKFLVLMSTEGTRNANIYQLSKNNNKINHLNMDNQNVLNKVIYDTKIPSFNKEENLEKIKKVMDDYKKSTFFILGCTELSLYNDDLIREGYNVIDPLRLLAHKILNLK